MNPRQKNIIKNLIENKDNYITTKKLSDIFTVSERTIRNDLNDLEIFLRKNLSSAKIIRKSGVGIRLNVKYEEVSLLLKKISSNEKFHFTERRIRKYHLIFILLMSKVNVTLNDLAERFFVSKRNIRIDLKKTNFLLEKYSLNLEIKRGVGIKILGEEKNKRELLVYIIKKIRSFSKSNKGINDIFDKDEIIIVKKSLEELGDEYTENIIEKPMNSLVLHILFMINRIKMNKAIVMSKSDWEIVNKGESTKEALKIIDYLSDKMDMDFNKDEVGYLSLRLRSLGIGQKHVYNDKCVDEEDLFINDVVENLIKEMNALYSVDLSDDDILKNNLVNHLKSAFTRVKSGFHISNPLIDDIKKEYTQMFFVINLVLDKYMKEFGERFPEEEICYVVIHFQAAIERLYYSQKNLKVIIVCNYGVGVSSFIEAKLNTLFPNLEILDLVVMSNLYNYTRMNEVDFVLSTVPIDMEIKKKVVEISPLLEKNDIDKISRTLENIEMFNLKSVEFDISSYSNPFLVSLNILETDRFDVIKKLVNKLEEKNYVIKNEFLKSTLEREKISSTCIGNKIAIPHGNPLFVKRSAISIATLKYPISWGKSMVSIIVLLALKKEDMMNKEIKNFFALLNKMSSNDLLLDELIYSDDKLRVLRYFSKI